MPASHRGVKSTRVLALVFVSGTRLVLFQTEVGFLLGVPLIALVIKAGACLLDPLKGGAV